MYTDRTDERWQQLQARIERMLEPYLGVSLQKIEYKAPPAMYQLEMPAPQRQSLPDAR